MAGVPGHDTQPTAGATGLEQQLGQASQQLASYFPVWLLLCCGVAFLRPALLSGITSAWISAGLALTMLSMGLTLSTEACLR